MSNCRSLSPNYIASRIKYNPETGRFYFKPRLVRTTKDIWWNYRHAGKETGKIRQGMYSRIYLDGIDFRAHVIAFVVMNGKYPEPAVDHIDRDPSNNRWSNLREATCGQNMINRPAHPNSKTGLKGIRIVKGGYIMVDICCEGKRYRKHCKTLRDAYEHYKVMAPQLQGPFALIPHIQF